MRRQQKTWVRTECFVVIMKRTWLYALIVLAVLVVAYLLRERYTNYADALNAVGQTPGYTTTNPTTGQTTTTGVGTAGTPTTGNTTGGTTTNPQPSSGGVAGGSSPSPLSDESQKVAGVPGNNVFGPPFVGVGTNGNDTGNIGAVPYPYLYGPKPDVSTMVPGAGIAGPSQASSLADSGVLPNASGTGSDPKSQFFGTSRVPGDKDLVPNPYSMNTSFSPSSSSSKTEPLPYLTDFSAFAK